MHDTLLILAAGASSRMKSSAPTSSLSEKEIDAANSKSKALIGIGKNNRPLLDYLLLTAKKAGYTKIVLVVGEQADAFKNYYGHKFDDNLTIEYVTQFIPKEREKPLGTADAVYQALQQLPSLQAAAFTVCNCDNLYSMEALEALRTTSAKNAFISYDREGLDFSMERISRFALVALDTENYVTNFIEKPMANETEAYRDSDGKFRVSMNIFKFTGAMIFPFLANCPIHPERLEKELPTAIVNMCEVHPKAMLGIPFHEHVPDLTSKADIEKMKLYLQQHFSA